MFLIRLLTILATNQLVKHSQEIPIKLKIKFKLFSTQKRQESIFSRVEVLLSHASIFTVLSICVFIHSYLGNRPKHSCIAQYKLNLADSDMLLNLVSVFQLSAIDIGNGIAKSLI